MFNSFSLLLLLPPKGPAWGVSPDLNPGPGFGGGMGTAAGKSPEPCWPGLWVRGGGGALVLGPGS